MAFYFTYDEVIDQRIAQFLDNYGYEKFLTDLGIEVDPNDVMFAGEQVSRELYDSTTLYDEVFDFVVKPVYFEEADIRKGLEHAKDEDNLSKSDISQVERYLAEGNYSTADRYLMSAVADDYVFRAVSDCIEEYINEAQGYEYGIYPRQRKVKESTNKTAWKYNNLLRG